mgnify:CR=1 FL=1
MIEQLGSVRLKAVESDKCPYQFLIPVTRFDQVLPVYGQSLYHLCQCTIWSSPISPSFSKDSFTASLLANLILFECFINYNLRVKEEATNWAPL